MAKHRKDRQDIVNKLVEKGFTGDITVEYEHGIGVWVCSCDQMDKVPLSRNVDMSLMHINLGNIDKYLTLHKA